MEVVMASVLAVYVARWGVPFGWESVDVLVLFGLVALVFFDARWFILPDVFTYGLSVLLLIRLAATMPEAFPGAFGTAVFLAAVFFFLYMVTRGAGVGLGDVKLGIAIGLLFGFPGGLVVTTAAIWAGALVGIGLMVAGKADRKTPMPFGTFWAAAAVVALLVPEPVSFVSSLLTLP
jgi:leader peptidase (prepilin peptidase)/N-methyltransferase